MEAIIKFQRQRHEAHIAAMWLLFLRTPANENPDIDGMFDLGEIGETAPMRFDRMTPYSTALPKHKNHDLVVR